jgi:hypothetical protein
MQFNLFDEPLPQSTATREVLVRSYLRSVKGAEKPARPFTRPAQPRKAQRGTDSPSAPHNGTDTSRAAADSLSSKHIQAQEQRVISVMRDAGKRGLIREEIAKRTGLELTDVCRVVNGLAGATRSAQRAGRPTLVTDGPDTRRSSHGRSQKIVRAV